MFARGIIGKVSTQTLHDHTLSHYCLAAMKEFFRVPERDVLEWLYELGLIDEEAIRNCRHPKMMKVRAQCCYE